jgi:hypothetical protein
MATSRIYYYKLTADNGGAPCVDSKLLTLAICKPRIRSTADVGDIIFGFGGRATLGERLIYIAEITGKLRHGDYYRAREYAGRKDRIYEWRDDRLEWRSCSSYHEGGHQADIGTFPQYADANVLLSTNFRYFGAIDDESYRDQYSEINAAIHALGKGHRVNHTRVLYVELMSLKADVWNRYPRKMKLGQPSDADKSTYCGGCEGGDFAEAQCM